MHTEKGMGEMAGKKVTLEAALYFVATPIGSARDITLRALDVLTSADVLSAEDTRTLRHLMELHGVPLEGRQVIAYHDHNGAQVRPKLLAALDAGKSVAYASEAGTPLVADPGYGLAKAAIEAGVLVRSAPGPSALLAALTVSGLPTDQFSFLGFAPNAAGARAKFIAAAAMRPGTLVFYESPKRVEKLLSALAQELGANRQAVLCRELTKKFEESRRGTLGELLQGLHDSPVKGECVVLVAAKEAQKADENAIRAALKEVLLTESLRNGASMVAEQYDWPRRAVYQIGLSLKGDA
jgi:16S rRNA (cytidine1402-2'-O)-methyltransferase